MKIKLLVTIIITALIITLFYYWSKPAEVEAPHQQSPASLRHLQQGSIIGYNDQANTHAWVGIPFAAPPIGELRWKAPRPASNWEGILNATKQSDSCVQLKSELVDDSEATSDVFGNEDCLYLNIWAPAMNAPQVDTSSKLPVMVWIYGGGNTIGSSKHYEAHQIASSQNAIVVVMNYRLGFLGWFRHESLRDNAKGSYSQLDASGNYGILDQIAALQWVQDNIANFGGEPNNVTIFGESAGGRNIYSLIASQLTEGLFHKAIIQSGSVGTDSVIDAEQRSIEGGYSSNDLIVEYLENSDKKQEIEQLSNTDLADFLYSLSPEELLAPAQSFGMGMYASYQNFNDGYVIPKKPLLEVFHNPSSFNPIPIITGTNRDEQKLFMAFNEEFVTNWFGVIPRIKDKALYNRISMYSSLMWKALAVDVPAKILSQHQPVYAYRFDWDDGPKNWLVDMPQLIGAGHVTEIAFVFGDFDGGMAFKPLYTEENEAERINLSNAMMDYWGSFAREGVPSANANAKWMPWDNEAEQMMILDSKSGGDNRMSESKADIATIKQSLENDDLFSQELKCRMYKELFLSDFHTTSYGSLAEYKQWGAGGCNN